MQHDPADPHAGGEFDFSEIFIHQVGTLGGVSYRQRLATPCSVGSMHGWAAAALKGGGR
jgi:hypothetical protein